MRFPVSSSLQNKQSLDVTATKMKSRISFIIVFYLIYLFHINSNGGKMYLIDLFLKSVKFGFKFNFIYIGRYDKK